MFRYSLWAVGAAASFSLMAVFVKLASGEFNAFELVFWRALFTLAFMTFVVRTQRLSVRTRYAGGHLVRGTLGTASMVLWFFTIGKMPISTNMTLIYTTPIFMAAAFLAIAVFTKRRPAWGTILAILAGFSGITLVLRPSFEAGYLAPSLICLSSAAIDMFVYFQMQYLGKRQEPSWRIVFYFALMSVCVAPVGAVLFSTGMHLPRPDTVWAVLGMGLCGTMGQLCTTKAYTNGNLLLSACLGFTAIPFSALIGVVFFSDAIDAPTALGMAIVIAASVFATVYTRRREAGGA